MAGLWRFPGHPDDELALPSRAPSSGEDSFGAALIATAVVAAVVAMAVWVALLSVKCLIVFVTEELGTGVESIQGNAHPAATTVSNGG